MARSRCRAEANKDAVADYTSGEQEYFAGLVDKLGQRWRRHDDHSTCSVPGVDSCAEVLG